MTNVGGTISLDSTATLSLSVTAGYTPAANVFYLLTRVDYGAFSNTFAGAPEGSMVSFGGASGTITYLANWTGDQATSSLSGGNDVAVFNVIAIPEPAAVMMLVASFGSTFGLQRFRRRAVGVTADQG
jgi:hypothetical protein